MLVSGRVKKESLDKEKARELMWITRFYVNMRNIQTHILGPIVHFNLCYIWRAVPKCIQNHNPPTHHLAFGACLDIHEFTATISISTLFNFSVLLSHSHLVGTIVIDSPQLHSTVVGMLHDSTRMSVFPKWSLHPTSFDDEILNPTCHFVKLPLTKLTNKSVGSSLPSTSWHRSVWCLGT